MTRSYGEANPALTKAIRRVSSGDTINVSFAEHAEDAMDDRGFDHHDVLTCLKRGTAYGPEFERNQWRANVAYRGLEIRVVVGGLDEAINDWSALSKVRVITVIREK